MGRQLYSAKRELLRDLLREVRAASGLTQLDLSKKLARPQSYVSDYERGHRRLDWVSVDEVVMACGHDLTKFARDYVAAAAKIGIASGASGKVSKVTLKRRDSR